MSKTFTVGCLGSWEIAKNEVYTVLWDTRLSLAKVWLTRIKLADSDHFLNSTSRDVSQSYKQCPKGTVCRFQVLRALLLPSGYDCLAPFRSSHNFFFFFFFFFFISLKMIIWPKKKMARASALGPQPNKGWRIFPQKFQYYNGWRT